MTAAVIILTALLCFAALWLLSLRGKRAKPGFFGLAAWHYAHRGLHGAGAPENSMEAFRRAVACGYGAELDVHLTKDGRLAVMHDESLRRTAGIEKNLCDCTSEELTAVRLEGTEEHLPYLEEVLPIFAGKAPLVIELKPFHRNHAALTEQVCALLNQFPNLQFCVESFDPRVLLWLKRYRPDIVRGQLSCDFVRDRNGLAAATARLLTGLTANFLTVPHFVAYKFEDRNRLALRVCRSLWGVQEFSWTIRSMEDAKTALDGGALIIFEDCRPEGRKEGQNLCMTN